MYIIFVNYWIALDNDNNNEKKTIAIALQGLREVNTFLPRENCFSKFAYTFKLDNY